MMLFLVLIFFIFSAYEQFIKGNWSFFMLVLKVVVPLSFSHNVLDRRKWCCYIWYYCNILHL